MTGENQEAHSDKRKPREDRKRKERERKREKRERKNVQGQLLCIQFTKRKNYILAEMLEISKTGWLISRRELSL